MGITRSIVEVVHDEGYGDDLLFHINSAMRGKDMRAEKIVATEPTKPKTMQPFWMVLGRGVPVFRHSTEASARVEAERLAKLNSGQVFTVLKAIGQTQIPPSLPEWLTFDDAEAVPAIAHPYVCKCEKCEAERPF